MPAARSGAYAHLIEAAGEAMAARREAPYERMLRLAAYVAEHRQGRTRADVARDVPGYGNLAPPALEKLLQRDRATLADSLGIRIEWSDADQCYTLHPPFFTAAERAALITAAALVGVEGVGEHLAPAELGGAVAQDVARIVVRVHGRVVELRDAIAARRAVRFRYHDGLRTVDPYAVGMWRNRWYLVGREHEADARRKYRLDRVETTIASVGEPAAYEIPADFVAADELRMDPNEWGTDPPLTASVRVVRDQLPVFLGELAGTVVATDAETATVELVVRDYASFVIRLLGFGTGAVLLEPPELVERLQAWLAPQAEAG